MCPTAALQAFVRGDEPKRIAIIIEGVKVKTPDAAMPLVRAVAEWTSRGDIPDSAKCVGSLSNLCGSVY